MAFRYAGLPVDTFQIAVAPLGPGATVPPMSSTSDSGVPRDTTFAVGGRGTASAGVERGGTSWGAGGPAARGRGDRTQSPPGAAFSVLSAKEGPTAAARQRPG